MASQPTPPQLPIRYPAAIWEPLTGHSAPGTLGQRDLIVLHITAGPTARSAINTFKASVAPHRVSAHFVVDRDGSVYQLLDLRDTAWHASEVNSRSIGIEHAAIPVAQGVTEGLPVTDEQYQASGALVAWLCRLLRVPCDTTAIQSHNAASPADHHSGCCEPTLSVDRVIELAQRVV